MGLYVEEWRPVVGFDGHEVSSMGRVRSVPRTILRGGATPVRLRSWLLRTSVNSRGYAVAYLRRQGLRAARTVHRLVAEAFLGKRPRGADIRHLDGNRFNNTVVNLRYGSRSENERDKIAHGSSNRGGRNGNAKLSAADVVAIRSMRQAGALQREIAVRFGISRRHVGQVLAGRSWGWSS